MALMLGGTGVSRGIAIGTVRLLHEIQPMVTARRLPRERIEAEVTRFRTALHAAIEDLRSLQSRLRDSVPSQLMGFLDSHLLMLEDETLSKPVINLIRKHAYSAEWALALHRDALVELFASIEDSYLRQRGEDVENVIAKVLLQLGGVRRSEERPPRGGYIVVTDQLAPADLIVHQHDGMRGLVCTHGNIMSHAAIVARSLQIPAVTGVARAISLISEGDELILDGGTGMVVAEPDRRSLRHYRGIRRAEQERRRKLARLRDQPCVTTDGCEVELWANVDTSRDATQARKVGAAGVGLFRTESLYLDRQDLPTEAEQLSIYRRLLRAQSGRPVVIRTMDLWAGHAAAVLPGNPHDTRQPALGLRAIRLCLRHPDIFRTQLRAILRASGSGPVRLLLPMVSCLTELRAARNMIEQVRAELAEQRYNFDPNMPLGVLIEVPAAAVTCQMFAPHVDFFSIGSNDLTQYTLAVDRDDDAVEQLYNPLHPAVLRLIRNVIKVARAADKPLMLCGEMAADPRVARLLVGLGLRSLSLHPASLLDVKDSLMRSDTRRLVSPARLAMRAEDPERTRSILDRLQKDR